MITFNLALLTQLLLLLLLLLHVLPQLTHGLAKDNAGANTNPSAINAPPSPPPPPPDPFHPFPRSSAYFMTISHPNEDYITIHDALASLTRCLHFYHSDAITRRATDLALISTPTLHWNVDPVFVRGAPQIFIRAENPATEGVAYGDVWKVLEGLEMYARAWMASEDFWMPSVEFETRWVVLDEPEMIRRVKGWMSVNREESGNGAAGGGGLGFRGGGEVKVAGNEKGVVVLRLI